MKRLLLATSALIVAGSAQAADLGARPYTKAPVVAAIPFSWSGCYIGGHVGGGASRTGFTDPGVSTPTFGGPVMTTGLVPGDRIGVNGDVGIVGGAQVGCDYQFSSNWVIGIAGDFTATDIHGVANDPFFGGKAGNPATLSSRTDWVASVTGRVGYTWDRFLVYGKGGVGFAHDRYSLNNFTAIGGFACPGVGFLVFEPCNSSASTDRIGWVAGAGIEWAFAPNWSALIEYNHYGFDSKRVGFTNQSVGTTALLDIRQDIDIVKVGINYRFGGSPVVAKY
ncbi:outer membrane protein [Bradyrhizobium cajani]|uniref:Outer membrane beta-barrel protein n=1 Tax=Bradyrhizobium cajani TaxID=1928661 RepID=A0A844TE25_9BRAD|nr:outer membrane beta-barrel protein [Bradyrhizobium cajani]MCP3372345.1 outer membrane beta-barrel protein [Bradyrhizobium cajani]MVT77298.1 outer membrane beta-barrel protein [Bradyrhizobium cajani]